MLILAIETSCDETAASVIHGEDGKIEMLSNIVSSQVNLHAPWGGVVPNLAAREHLKNILPVIQESLQEAKINPQNLDLIAVTNGPGLIPALLVGTNCAKTLSYLWKKPLLGIHHIEGHIYANFISDKIGAITKNQETRNKIIFPALCLVVSGGHTQLIFMQDHLHYEIVGQTQDDAVGEAFDKVARILDLGYPGGPIIAAEAAKSDKRQETRDKLPPRADQPMAEKAENYKLPRPMLASKDFNFSFSGLKTAVLYLVKKNEALKKNPEFIQAICHEFQQASIDVLVHKTLEAAKKFNPYSIMLAGGVSANQELRKQLEKAVKENLPTTKYFCPELKYTGDNAAMIGAAAYFRWEKIENKEKYLEQWKNISTDANLPLH